MNIEQEIWNDFKELSESGLADKLSYGSAAAHYGVAYDDKNSLVHNGLNKRLEFDEDYKINKFLLSSDFKNVDWSELEKLYPHREPVELPKEKCYDPTPKYRSRKENRDICFFLLNEWEDKRLKLFYKIPTEEVATDYLIDIRWDGTPKCPKCDGIKLYFIKGGALKYRCPKCDYKFSEKVGTIFQNSKLSLIKWYTAMYLLTSIKTRKISTTQLSTVLQITKTSAWLMSTKIQSKIGDEFITKIKYGLFTND